MRASVSLDSLIHVGTTNSFFLARRNGGHRFLVAKLYNRTHIQSQPDLACAVRIKPTSASADAANAC
jgi:hypothetical protein